MKTVLARTVLLAVLLFVSLLLCGLMERFPLQFMAVFAILFVRQVHIEFFEE